MPSKKKKYNARFPAGRIKKIMQTDEEIGKVAQAVPVIISRTLELFVESLLKKAMQITSAKNAKTLTPTHMKQCILSESRFDFLKDLVKGIPDISSIDDEIGNQCGSSPGAQLMAKGYPAFQFHQSFDSSSSRSSNIASQQITLQNSQPKFYKEIPIGNENPEKDASYEKTIPPGLSGRTVIQHTGLHQLNHFPCPGLPPPPTTAVDSSDKIPLLAWNPTNRNATQLNELGSNCIKRQNENSTLAGEREKKNLAEEEDEDEDEEEEEDEEERHETRENGYHKQDNALDEDYDT